MINLFILIFLSLSLDISGGNLSSENIVSDVHNKSELTPTNISKPYAAWYLDWRDCSIQSTYCCCESGNSMVCDLPGAQFICLKGGPFECGAELSGCEDNPSNCGGCCPSCA